MLLRAFGLGAILLLTCFSALADSASAWGTGTTGVSVSGSGLNISLISANVLDPWLSTYGNGVISTGSQTYSWANGTLTVNFGPASATAFGPHSSFVGAMEQFDALIQVVNPTSSVATVALTSFVDLQWGGAINNSNDWHGVEWPAVGQRILPGGSFPEYSVVCSTAWACGSYIIWSLNPGDQTTLTSGPLASSFDYTFLFTLPADSTQSFDLGSMLQLEAYGDPIVTPEPGTWALIGSGLLGLMGLLWRRSRDRASVGIGGAAHI